MNSIKVKRKLFKCAANVEDCYKMLLSKNVTDTEVDHLSQSVRNVDLQEKDCVKPVTPVTDDIKDFTDFHHKEEQKKASSVNESTPKYFQDQIVQTLDTGVATCDVGIQTDLCQCSHKFQVEIRKDSPVRGGKSVVKKEAKTLKKPKRVSSSPRPSPLDNEVFVDSNGGSSNWTSPGLPSDRPQKDIGRGISLDISSSEEISFISCDDDRNHSSESLKFSQTSDGDKNTQNLANKSTKYGRRKIDIEANEFHLSFLASLSPGIEDHLIHPEARRFVTNFGSTKVELGKLLYDIFNDKVFAGKLRLVEPLVWNKKMTSTAGHCCPMYKDHERHFRIELSIKVCDTPDKLRDTLVHEMCHAYVWTEYGSNEDHGVEWRKWAVRVNVILKDLPPVTRCHNYEVITKYTYICQGCGAKFKRQRQMKNVGSRRCPKCEGGIQLLSVRGKQP